MQYPQREFDQFMQVISLVMEKTVLQAEAFVRSTNEQRTTEFVCGAVYNKIIDSYPTIEGVTVTQFVTRLGIHMTCDVNVFITAIQFLDSYCAKTRLPLVKQVFFRLFFICVVLARKVLEDAKLSIDYLCQVGGFEHETDVKELELDVLTVLEWKMTIDENVFWDYHQKIKVWINGENTCR